MVKRQKKVFLKTALAISIAATFPGIGIAQGKVEANINVDLVSSYIWRGQDLGNVSIQPLLSVSYKGVSLSAWGNAGFEKNDTKEIDITLSYATGGFSVSVTDYWADGGAGYFHYGARNTNHTFEAQIGYDFGPITANWYTNFAGIDGVNKEGNRAYSSYISITAPFNLGGLEWTAEVGATPWATDFYNYIENPDNLESPPVCNGLNGFAVCDISLAASKDIKITSSFSVPVFAKISWNPQTEGTYFAFGMNF